MVEAAGVESQIGAFANWLTSRDFWANSLKRGQVLPLVVSTHVDGEPHRSTGFMETCWRRRESFLELPAALDAKEASRRLQKTARCTGIMASSCRSYGSQGVPPTVDQPRSLK